MISGHQTGVYTAVQGRVFVMSNRVRYSKEFRFQAARLVAEEGYMIKKAAAHLGINAWTLRDWVRQFRSDGSLLPAKITLPTNFT